MLFLWKKIRIKHLLKIGSYWHGQIHPKRCRWFGIGFVLWCKISMHSYWGEKCISIWWRCRKPKLWDIGIPGWVSGVVVGKRFCHLAGKGRAVSRCLWNSRFVNHLLIRCRIIGKAGCKRLKNSIAWPLAWRQAEQAVAFFIFQAGFYGFVRTGCWGDAVMKSCWNVGNFGAFDF